MTATAKKLSASRSRIIQAALDLDSISTDFLIGMSPEDFHQFAQECPIYNEMDRKSFVALAEFIDAKAPRMDYGPGHCNTGQHFITLKVGNEYSRVVYVELGGSYISRRSKERDAFLTDLKRKATEAHADEFSISVQSHGSISVRMWWD